MIAMPGWIKAEVKPYMHQISIECMKKLVDCIEKFNKDDIDISTLFKTQNQILIDEFDDNEFLSFAIENFSEMMGYITSGKVNIRIHRDIEGEMWFGVG